MSLLPKTEIDFAQAEYWNKFFRKRGSKEFEWYGKFSELSVFLQKYIKYQDSILMVGCGNSTLSLDLYDFGYRKITNIDISSIVIAQMKVKVGSDRPGMIFEEMDALNMSYAKETFSVVLDKGTLDALMPSNTEEDKLRAAKLFSQVDKVLKMNGRYLIISLLQEHILIAILEYFIKIGWFIRILRCWDVEKQHVDQTGSLTMPVFMVVCVKLKNPLGMQSILEMNVHIDENTRRLTSKDEMVTAIKDIQRTIFHCRESQGEMELTLFKNGEENPRYTLYIVDATQDYRKLLKYAAFIVPHGRESEWMFGRPEGRKYLRESTGFDRLAVVIFHRNQIYGSLTEVQDELRESVLGFTPPLVPVASATKSIPYLSLGDGVGRRTTVYSGTSQFSGDLVVEDVEIENEIFRRLVFLNNQSVVQSEVKLKRRPEQSEGKNNRDGEIDLSHVASHHILYMAVALGLTTSNAEDADKHGKSVAVIGVGGGSLCLLLRSLFPTTTVTGVEIDPLVVQLARRYFGLVTDDRLNVLVEDGLEFLMKRNHWDIIMLDVDSKERGSALGCPPPGFVESSVLASVAESLGERGVFVINVVSRVNSEHEKLLKKLKKHFRLMCWYNLKEDVNRIVFATNAKCKSHKEWQRDVIKSAEKFESACKEKVRMGEGWVDLDHFMSQLTI